LKKHSRDERGSFVERRGRFKKEESRGNKKARRHTEKNTGQRYRHGRLCLGKKKPFEKGGRKIPRQAKATKKGQIGLSAAR